jgi:hypothetical protein
MRKLPRVFFNTNEGGHDHGYLLGLPSSKADLAALKGGPVEGAHVVIYMPDELEREATLHWNEALGEWVAMPVAGTIQYLDGTTL